MKTSQKFGAGLLAVSAVFSAVAPMQVSAKEFSNKPTSSGSTSGNQTNTIKNEICTGNKKLSGTDKKVFDSTPTPLNSKQSIICAKSLGFKTEISGASNVKNYHWTAWYKDSFDAPIDKTQTTGNYHGFSKDKINDWKPYEENIRALNGGRFPAYKDYRYPTDTNNGKLDFWADVAGYYSILGDPQFQKIHMDAYQKFSYTVETVTVNEYSSFDSNYCNENPGLCRPKPKPKPESSGGNSGGNSGGSGGNNDLEDINPNYCREHPKAVGCGTYVNNTCGSSAITTGCVANGSFTDVGSSRPNADQINPGKPQGGIVENKPSGNSNHKPGSGAINGYLSETGTTTRRVYHTDADGYATGKYTEYTTVIKHDNKTKEVKVASADVAQNAYATEIAAYGRLSLQPGSKGTVSKNVPMNKFWNKKPGYWTDNGKATIKNNSNLPYHFGFESSEGAGKNNVNLYAKISKRDKLYSLIHGFPDISDLPKGNGGGKVPNPNNYPKNEGNSTCVKVHGKEYCSIDSTPIINTEIDIDKDNPQSLKEVDKIIHLTK